MAEKKQDLRIKKTQRALAMALFTLLETKGFGKISVNDLCTEAMVSRSAFYTHFEDKYALLGFCIEFLRQRTFEQAQPADLRARIYTVLEKAQENAKIFRNLLLSKLDIEVMEMMRQSFQTTVEQLLAQRQISGEQLPGPVEVVSTYYVSGITSAILLWITQNLPYSIDEMTDCLLGLLPKEL